MKKTNTIIFALILVLTLISLVSADDLIKVCLKDGERIHVTSTEYFTCHLSSGTGNCQTCANSSFWYHMNSSCMGLPCTYLNASSNGSNPPTPSLTLTTKWPFTDNAFFNKQNFLLDISTNQISSISLIDEVRGTETLLCANCNFVGSSRTFSKGFNNITIRAVSGLSVKESKIKFTIDNAKPVITKTLPISNNFVVNNFVVLYSEDYVDSIVLNYGALGNYHSQASNACDSGVNKNCSFNIDLSEFDNQQISYWFEINDKAGNFIQSSSIKVFVDESAPSINSFEVNVSGAYVNFRINLTETYLNKIEYIDYNDLKPVFKTLCSSLKNNICQTKVSLKDGYHNLSIKISDKSGYLLFKNITVFTDSKKPVITKTLPASNSYSNSTFFVMYDEDYLKSVALTYGTKMNYNSINLSACNSGKKQNCSIKLNLPSLENSKIDYWFTLTDNASNTASSMKTTITIDTIAPAMSNVFAITGKGYATINATVIDTNFYKLQYKDSFDSVPVFKTLCSSLKNNVCSIKLYLKPGTHNLSLFASDKAGNTENKNITVVL